MLQPGPPALRPTWRRLALRAVALTASLVAATLFGAAYWRRLVADDARRLRGLRVDPAYFYEPSYQAAGVHEAASAAALVTASAAAAGIDTLFVRAYDPRYGAYYLTDYPATTVEGKLGRENVLHEIVVAGKRHGLRVVAWLAVNDFAAAWEAHPEWRSKRRDGRDYQPDPAAHPLSARHPGYRAWYEGLVADLLAREPELAGVEAAEASVDQHWNDDADYNDAGAAPAPGEAGAAPAPGEAGVAAWRAARAADLTSMHRALARVVHARGRLAFVVQTWTADTTCDGSLMPSTTIRDHSGFDFDGILDAPPAERPDYVTAELMWQQWRDSCGKDTFDPAWTRRAGRAFVAMVGGRAGPIVHVELTPFGAVVPSDEQVRATLAAAWSVGVGLDVYDDRQLRARAFLGPDGALAAAIRPLPARLDRWWADVAPRWARRDAMP